MPEPLLLSPTEAAKMIGIGKTLFYSLASSGAIGPVPVELGSKKLYRVEELTNWVNCGCPPRRQWVDILSHEENGPISKDKNK